MSSQLQDTDVEKAVIEAILSQMDQGTSPECTLKNI